MMKVFSYPFYVAMVSCVMAMALASPLVLAAESTTSVSSEPTSTTATYGNWVLHCVQPPSAANGKSAKGSQEHCEIVQSAQVRGQSRPIMQMAIGRLLGQKEFMITAVLPTNVTIPGRVDIVIDDKSQEKEKDKAHFDLALTRCLPGGCVAVTKLSSKMRAQMSAGKTGQLRFISAEGQDIGIPLSWMGFSQAMEALASRP